MLQIHHVVTQDILVLKPSGRIDANTAQTFEEETLRHINASFNRIIIDFSLLDYLSSAGLRALLIVARNVKNEGGDAIMCSLPENINNVIKISGFDTILGVYSNVEDAVSYYKNQ
jgi:anti-anti-sigma factor